MNSSATIRICENHIRWRRQSYGFLEAIFLPGLAIKCEDEDKFKLAYVTLSACKWECRFRSSYAGSGQENWTKHIESQLTYVSSDGKSPGRSACTGKYRPSKRIFNWKASQKREIQVKMDICKLKQLEIEGIGWVKETQIGVELLESQDMRPTFQEDIFELNLIAFQVFAQACTLSKSLFGNRKTIQLWRKSRFPECDYEQFIVGIRLLSKFW